MKKKITKRNDIIIDRQYPDTDCQAAVKVTVDAFMYLIEKIRKGDLNKDKLVS